MGRTTICRSSSAVPLALVAALLVAPALAAQDTVQVAQDTAQVAPAAGDLPASHTVVSGETLWSIAQVYFTDPLLWPEIYRLNTDVVEDPHWIYPGEVLQLAPFDVVAQGPRADTVARQPQVSAADTVRAAPGDTVVFDTAQVIEAPPPPPVAETYETIFDRKRTRTEQVRDVLRAYAEQPYRPLRRSEFYAAGFLTEGDALPWANVLGNTATPSIHRLSDRTTAMRFEEIAIDPPRRASYHVGDSVLVVRIDRAEPGWGEVVVPIGVARVTDVQERQVLADVIMQFGRIRGGHLALPLEPFKDPGQVRATPVEQGLEGKVISQRDVHPLVGTQHFLFIDRGRADGVVLGDIFEVYRPAIGEPRTPSEEVRITLMVVHTREHSSTGLVIGVANPQVVPGMPVRLIRKMPS